MKITDLITHLEAIADEHGDLDIENLKGTLVSPEIFQVEHFVLLAPSLSQKTSYHALVICNPVPQGDTQ
jgi:hypothetical protein